MQSQAAITQPADAISSWRVRKRLLETGMVWMLILVFVAITVPWFLRVLAIDLAPAARATFAYTVVHVLVSMITDRMHRPRSLLAAAVLLQSIGIVFLGLLWHLVGGVQTPMLLLAFFPPVIASGILLGRWQTYLAALLSITVVTSVALAESPELRWYFSQLGISLDRIPRALPFLPLPGRPQPFPSLLGQPAYSFVLLEGFAALLLVCAWLSQSLSGAVLRLYAPLGSPADGVSHPQDIFEAALKASAAPAVLVFAEGAHVLLASDSFLRSMLLHGENLVGRDLFELIRFSEPDRVRSLIAEDGREMPFCAYWVGDEARVASLQVDPFQCRGESYACLRFVDRTDLYYLQTALQAVNEPLVVIGTDDRLCYANRAAEQLFGELHFGLEAAAVLERRELPERWWDARRSGPQERPVVIDGTSYWVSAVATVASDKAEAFSVVRLRREAGS